MLTLIIIIAICVWAWNKYKKTPTVYPNFFSRNKWVKWNLIVQIAISIFVALAGANMLSQGTSFLMGDWIGNIVGLLGFSDFSDLYGMAQESEMFDTSERMSSISEITSPLVMAIMVSSICAFVVLIIALYTLINLKQKKFDANRYYILSVIGAIGIVISTYLVNSKDMEFQIEVFGGNPESAPIRSVIYAVGVAVLLGFFLMKYKKNLTAIFDESEVDVEQFQVNSVSTPVSTTAEITKQCPYCGETILGVAKKCKHCGEWLPEEQPVVEEVEIKYIQCPICGEDVEEGTEICPHCDERIS
jgi:hypothetical protein